MSLKLSILHRHHHTNKRPLEDDLWFLSNLDIIDYDQGVDYHLIRAIIDFFVNGIRHQISLIVL